MNFELDPDQRALQDAVARFFKSRHDLQQRDRLLQRPLGATSPLWASLADLGLLGLLVPEAHGGAGKSMLDAAVVMEEIGKALVAEPYWMTAIAAVTCLCAIPNSAEEQKHFADLVSGRAAYVLASPTMQAEPRRAPTVTARQVSDGWQLDGDVADVVGADIAAGLIVHAQSEASGEACLFIVDSGTGGVVVKRHKCHDGSRGADLQMTQVTLEATACMARGDDARRRLAAARGNVIAALCSEAVGAMSAAFDLTIEYLRTRRQFGATLSSFQVLQHRAVDMLVAVEKARSMATFASVAACEQPSRSRERQLAAAKVQVCQSARFVGQQAVQLHGGIGMTEEYAVGNYFRRLTAIELSLGGQDHHVSTLVDAGGLFAES